MKKLPLKELLKPKLVLPLVVEGKVVYCERTRSRSLLVIKKDIRGEFVDLMDKDSSTCYRMEYFRYDRNAFEKRINEVLQLKGGLPLLLYLYKPEASGKVRKFVSTGTKTKVEDVEVEGGLVIERRDGKFFVNRSA